MQIYYEFFISATISSPNMTRDSNELKFGFILYVELCAAAVLLLGVWFLIEVKMSQWFELCANLFLFFFILTLFLLLCNL